MVVKSWPWVSPFVSDGTCEEEEEALPCGCFSSFCTRRCNLEVSDVWVEVEGEVEEEEEVDGLGKGGKGKGSW